MSLKWVLLLLLLLPTTLQFPQSGAFIIGPIVMKLRQDVHYAVVVQPITFGPPEVKETPISYSNLITM